MTQRLSVLHVGMVSLPDPTLLLIGDATSLGWLAEQIAAGRDTKLEPVPGPVRVGLHLVPATRGGRLTRIGETFDWDISAKEAQRFSQQLRELAASASPAHAYLDSELSTDGVRVLASIGEHDPEKVFAA